MSRYRSSRFLFAGATLIAGGLTLSSCTSSTAPAPNTSVASVAPAGGAASVITTTTVRMTFSDTMMASMSAYVSLHQGSVTGPSIAMTAQWSADHMTLTMTPSAPLTAGTSYYMHMGGGMTDAHSAVIDYSQCPGLGGQSATAAMMGGMMGEMGAGWMGTDSNYGWVFHFTTA